MSQESERKSTYAVFTDMLRHPSAKPLVNRARNFVEHFPSGLSRYEAADRVHNFLTQTEQYMFSDIVVFAAEADEEGIANASESLEKLVLCRMFSKAFDVDPADAVEDAKLKEHLTSLDWVEPKHLGIPSIEPSLWPRLIQELTHLNDYKAPGDKMICIVNACHVINDLLKRGQAEIGGSRPLAADDFLPLLIFAMMKANPDRLHSNAEFVAAFRHPSRMNGENAYWITMFCSAKEFLRAAGPATLEVAPEDYDRLCAASLAAAKGKASCPTVKSQDPPKPVVVAPSEIQEVKDALLAKEEVLVYQIPAVSSASGHKSADWEKLIWKGPCKIINKEEDLAIRMLDSKTGQLFAECVIPRDEYDKYVEPVVDSNKCFVLKIRNGQRHAVIGLGFDAPEDAANFKQVLDEFRCTSLDERAKTTRSSQSDSQPAGQEQAAAQGSSTVEEDHSFDPYGTSSQACSDSLSRTSTSDSAGSGYPTQVDMHSEPNLDMINLESSPSQVASTDLRPTQELTAVQEQVLNDATPVAQPPAPIDVKGANSPQAHSSQCADPFADLKHMILSDSRDMLSSPVTA